MMKCLQMILAGAIVTTAAADVDKAMRLCGAGAVKPDGWLKDRAMAARNGFTGHMDEVDEHFQRAWRADWRPRGEFLNWCGHGRRQEYSWSSEGGAYWFDGLVKLSRQLDDAELAAMAFGRVEPLIANMNEHAIGFVWWMDRRDPKQMAEMAGQGKWQYWVLGIAEKAVAAYYEATGDERAKQALKWAFNDPASVNAYAVKATALAAAVESARITGDGRVRECALKAVQRFREVSPYANPPQDWVADTLNLKRRHLLAMHQDMRHGVAACENLLSIFRGYQLSGDVKLRDSVLAWYDFFAKYARQPYGHTVMDEEWGWAGAMRGTETCDVAAENWLRVNLLEGLGEGRFGDDLERSQFNAAPACVSRDFTRHVYMQLPNRVERNPDRSFSSTCAGEEFAAYKRSQWPLCCTAALNRVLPNYLQAMWMKTADGGIAAALYGPCSFTCELGGGKVAVAERTRYPFSDKIELEFREVPGGAFPLVCRIPGWCGGWSVAVNGERLAPVPAKGFVKIVREWRRGDVVTLQLPMKPKVETMRDMNDFGRRRAFVTYGPLLMARGYAERDDNTPAEPIVEPALDVASVATARVVAGEWREPWNWPLDAPVKVVARDGAGRDLVLVPYGCTKLRTSLFDIR